MLGKWSSKVGNDRQAHRVFIMAGVQDLKAAKDLEDLGSFRGLVVAHFWTPWSEPCKQMNDAMEDLAKEYERVKFFKVN